MEILPNKILQIHEKLKDFDTYKHIGLLERFLEHRKILAILENGGKVDSGFILVHVRLHVKDRKTRNAIAHKMARKWQENHGEYRTSSNWQRRKFIM